MLPVRMGGKSDAYAEPRCADGYIGGGNYVPAEVGGPPAHDPLYPREAAVNRAFNGGNDRAAIRNATEIADRGAADEGAGRPHDDFNRFGRCGKSGETRLNALTLFYYFGIVTGENGRRRPA